MKLCPTCQQCYEDGDLSCAQQGHAPLIVQRAGTRLIDNKYRVDRLLGVGGMGAVYRCTHVGLKQPMAIKLLHPNSAEADPYGRQRLLREAFTACRLNHPNLVRVHDSGTNVITVADETGTHKYDELYVVMELLDGQTLRDYLDRAGRLSLKQALLIACQVACGLSELHSKGVLHRDLKPANIMLTRDYRGDMLVKIVDLGAVKFINRGPALDDVDLTGTMMVGSARYTSPENCRGEPLDERSDIYCLGLILYEMLGGRHPFKSRDRADLIYQHAYIAPPALDEVCDGLPAPLVRLVTSSLAKSPETRPRSAAEVLRVLLDFTPQAVRLDPEADDRRAGASEVDRAEEPDADEETRVVAASADESSPDGLFAGAGVTVESPASRREARHMALGLMYFVAFLAAAIFLSWSFLSRGPLMAGAAPAGVGGAAPKVPRAEVGDELIATTDINIRNEPSLKAQKVGLAEKGSRVRVLSRSGNWREVVVLSHGRPKKDEASADRGWLDRALLSAPEE